MQWTRRIATALGVGACLGVSASTANAIPILLNEVGKARAQRSGWSQAAEFSSLVLDSGWAWAAIAVLAGWLTSSGLRPNKSAPIGALGGCLALVAATVSYYLGELLFTGAFVMNWIVRFWFIGSIVLGLFLGTVGALIRRPGLTGTLAALVVPTGAAANMIVFSPAQESLMAKPVMFTVWVLSASAAILIVLHAKRVKSRGSQREAKVEPPTAKV